MWWGTTGQCSSNSDPLVHSLTHPPTEYLTQSLTRSLAHTLNSLKCMAAATSVSLAWVELQWVEDDAAGGVCHL